ncbi:MAG TPA: 50S ribosomal protein L21, partial [Gaiellales bacterium]|nr:50S ribosomal protein L21 [Gaiellales bacterium]
MYAVIKIGGKQYRVEEGQKLLVDRQSHAAGEAFTPDVLMTGGDDVVTDRSKLEGAVSVQVVEHLRGEKIKVF